MNYFELFEIPVSLHIDRSVLAQKYFALQKIYHPDYFAQSTESEQEDSLVLSSMVNKAFKTFQSPDETIKYVLQMKGLLEEEEKYELPPPFLIEVMELNEMKMDGVSPEEITNRTKALQQEIYAEVAPIIAQYHEGTSSNLELLAVKEYYYKKKYLDRLLAE